MSSEPRPEGEPYLIWDTRALAWWGPDSIGYTARVDMAGRFSECYATDIDIVPGILIAVPLSVALRDGPPVEAPAEPKPGEVWRNRQTGVEVNVVRIYGELGERMVVYQRPEWTEPLEMSLALWPSHYAKADTIRPVEVLPGDESEVDLAPLFGRPRTPLSPEAQAARRPPPPETLIDTLPDTIHRESGRGRAARTVRVPGNDWSRAEALPYEEPEPDPTSLEQRNARALHWLLLVRLEVERTQAENRPFASAHEGLAIFEEEADELRRAVRSDDRANMVEEAVQAAAMAIRILVDCGGMPPNGESGDETV